MLLDAIFACFLALIPAVDAFAVIIVNVFDGSEMSASVITM